MKKSNSRKRSNSRSRSRSRTKLNNYGVLAYYESKPKMSSSKYISGKVEEEDLFRKGKFINKFHFIYDASLKAENISNIRKHLHHIGKLNKISDIIKI